MEKHAGSYQKRLAILLLLLVGYTVYAQDRRPLLKEADDHYMRHEYAEAVKLYAVMVKRNNDISILRKLAHSYQSISQYANAADIYARITTLPGAGEEDWLQYGDMLKSTARYDEARLAFRQVTTKDITLKLAGCDSAVAWKRSDPQYLLVPFEAINTAASDWGGVYYPGNNIVFVSSYDRQQETLGPKAKLAKYDDRRTDEPFHKIYLLDSSARYFIHGLAPVFNRYRFHTGPVSFSHGYTTAYFTVTNIDPVGYEKTDGKTKLGVRKLALMISHKKNGQWQPAYGFTYNRPDTYSVGHASLSNDGSILYFTSDMPGGYGKTDIWYSELQPDSSWGAPRNCGPVLNSAEEDDFPVVNNASGIYISSKGHIGMGGLDIFYAAGSRDQWQTPVNMRSPINSEADDFYFVQKSATEGMLSSNRPGGMGGDDVYRYVAVASPAPAAKPRLLPLTLRIIVTGRDNRGIPGATIWVDDPLHNTWLHTSGDDGTVWQTIEKKGYTVVAEKSGYTSGSAKHVPGNEQPGDTITVTVVLDVTKNTIPHKDSLRKGYTFVLENIYYDFDKWNIRPDATRELDKVVALMQSYPLMKIEFASHTDCRGSDVYNDRLSQKRSLSAVEYITRHGISRLRIQAKGYGKNRLVNGCDCNKGHDCTKERHAENRRTEITILAY